ncbi:MAG: hypothetical protein U9R25_14580 [Chloroflexota bacterium]|nr:hypothetical protein [Chloroflexota bacterium]
MSKNAPPNCRFYFEDYFRGQETIECRLSKGRESRHWHRKICDTCSVPDVLRETNCPYLAIEGTIRKQFLSGERMEIFVICTKHSAQLDATGYCARCAAEQDSLMSDVL